LALRFGSWWWTLSALPIGIILYDPMHSFETCKNITRKLLVRGKSTLIIECFPRFPELTKWKRDIIYSIRWCLIILRYSITYGLAGLSIWWIVTFFSVHLFEIHELRSFVFFFLATGLLDLMMLSTIRYGPGSDQKKPAWPIIRKISLWFPKPKQWSYEFSGETFIENLEKQGVLVDDQGKYFSVSRFANLCTDTAQKYWLVIQCACGVALCALTLPVVMVLVLTDMILTLLFMVTTRASIGAGIGGFVGALIEYHYYPHMENTAEDIFRFALFMTVGGLLGVGLYRLREWARREEMKPEVVSGGLY
jgi:hypothetical protein